MQWVRKSFGFLFAVILLTSLISLAASLVLNRNLGNPGPLKQWMAESKIYDNVVASLIADAAKADADRATLYNSQAVLQLADRTFTTDLVAQSVGTFLDSNYAWLKGETTEPTFSIDLSKQREAFATEVGGYVEARLTGLPVCSAAQLSQLQIPVDPLTINCRPASINATTEGKRVSQGILDSSFLSNSVITAKTVGQEGSQPYYADLSRLPQAFQISQKLPVVFAVAALIAALAVLYLAQTRRSGLRSIGFTLASAGLLLVVAKPVTDMALTEVRNQSLQTQGVEGVFRQPYIDLLNLAGAAITREMMLFGAAYLLVAAIIFIALLATRNRHETTKVERSSVDKQKPATQGNKAVPKAIVTNPAPVQPILTSPTPRAQSMDIMSSKPVRPVQKPITPEATPSMKRKPKPRRPRLVQ